MGEQVADRAKRPGIKDYKTRLQEHLARDGLHPEYDVDGTGPDHDRRFSAVVHVDGKKLGAGEGRSKKEAEQASASEALVTLSSSRP